MERFYSARNPAVLVAVVVETLKHDGYEITHADSVDGTVSAISIGSHGVEIGEAQEEDDRAEVTGATVRVTSDHQFCCYVMGHFTVVTCNRAGDIVPADESTREIPARIRASFFSSMEERLPWESFHGNAAPPFYTPRD